MNEGTKARYEQFMDKFVLPRKPERQVLEHFSSLLDLVEAEDSFFKTLHLDICRKNNVPHQEPLMEALQAMGKEPNLAMLHVVDNEKSRHYYNTPYSSGEYGIYLVVEQNTGFVVDMNCNELSHNFTLYGGIDQQDIDEETMHFFFYLSNILAKYDETFYTEGPPEGEEPRLFIMGTGDVPVQKRPDIE